MQYIILCINYYIKIISNGKKQIQETQIPSMYIVHYRESAFLSI